MGKTGTITTLRGRRVSVGAREGLMGSTGKGAWSWRRGGGEWVEIWLEDILADTYSEKYELWFLP